MKCILKQKIGYSEANIFLFERMLHNEVNLYTKKVLKPLLHIIFPLHFDDKIDNDHDYDDACRDHHHSCWPCMRKAKCEREMFFYHN